MEQAREALKKLNVFAEKAARMGLFREGRVASGEPNRAWSERHESFAFRLRRARGWLRFRRRFNPARRGWRVVQEHRPQHVLEGSICAWCGGRRPSISPHR